MGSGELPQEENLRRGLGVMSSEDKQNIRCDVIKSIGSRELSPIEKQYSSFPHHQYQSVETTSPAGIQAEKNQHFNRVPGSRNFGVRYDGCSRKPQVRE
ncbi:hypothetical protein OROMI_004016 [Orobanche minor]